MNSWFASWVFFRVAKWLLLLGLFAFSAYYISNPARYLNSFGHLTPFAEFMLFGLGILAMVAGLLELMSRDRGGIARPQPFRFKPYVE